jgi:hypothetical protein
MRLPLVSLNLLGSFLSKSKDQISTFGITTLAWGEVMTMMRCLSVDRRKPMSKGEENGGGAGQDLNASFAGGRSLNYLFAQGITTNRYFKERGTMRLIS